MLVDISRYLGVFAVVCFLSSLATLCASSCAPSFSASELGRAGHRASSIPRVRSRDCPFRINPQPEKTMQEHLSGHGAGSAAVSTAARSAAVVGDQASRMSTKPVEAGMEASKEEPKQWFPPTPVSKFEPVGQHLGQGGEGKTPPGDLEMLPPPAVQDHEDQDRSPSWTATTTAVMVERTGSAGRKSVMSIASLLNDHPQPTGTTGTAASSTTTVAAQNPVPVSPLWLEADSPVSPTNQLSGASGAVAPGAGGGGGGGAKDQVTPANRPVRKAARASAAALSRAALEDLAKEGDGTTATSTEVEEDEVEEEDMVMEEDEDDDDDEYDGTEEVKVPSYGAKGKKRKLVDGAGGGARKRVSIDGPATTKPGGTSRPTTTTTTTGGGKTKVSDRRISHSLIERRRREKINDCLSRLKSLVPQCREMLEEKEARAGERGRKRRRGGNHHDGGEGVKGGRKGRRGKREEEDELDEGQPVRVGATGAAGLHKLEILMGTV